MEAPQPVNKVPARKNKTLLIIAIIAIVLLCGCLTVAVAGYYGFIAIRSVETQISPIEDFEIPSAEPDSTFDTPDPSDGVGEPPTGGLGNDILRNDTWQYIGPAAIGLGCDQPVGPNSTIEVLQEPDGGVWKEKWIVACASGETYSFEVEYILDDTGATFNIRSVP
jgi:nitrate reductase NapE component